MLRKNWSALGVVRRRGPAARARPPRLPRASSSSTRSRTSTSLAAEHGDDLDFAYGIGARPQPRDRRLLRRRPPPARGRLRAARRLRARPRDGGRGARAGLQGAAWSRRRVRAGIRRATSASFRCGRRPRRPASRSSSTSAAAASCSTRTTSTNGLPPVPDFHGGAENFRSVDYMAIPHPPMQTLTDADHRRRARSLPAPQARRHRAGRGVDPGLDAAARLGPGRVLEERGAPAAAWRSVRASTCGARSAPRPTRTSRSAGSSPTPDPEVCLFSSDYPHVEGGRNPIKRFEDGMTDTPPATKDRFYADNFVDLMGAALA